MKNLIKMVPLTGLVAALGLLVVSCGKELPSPEAEPVRMYQITVPDDWGLTQVLAWTDEDPQPDCYACMVGCDCYSDIIVTPENGLNGKNNLDLAITNGTVDDFFTTGDWDEIIPPTADFTGSYLTGLQNDSLTMHLVVAPAPSSEEFYILTHTGDLPSGENAIRTWPHTVE